MLVLGLKDPFSKEKLMKREQSLEKTLQAARIAETSKQHVKSIKEEGSKVEKVDVVDGKGRSLNGECPVGVVVFDMPEIHVLLLGDAATSARKWTIFQGCVVPQMDKRNR